ncbi:alpha-L-fucosidase [Aeoliella mucimassa]|uniref:alpha-L-fucosidase n=1 Tax=Aeoliella mucimassa TaxID=2527972 RepID=A0A518AQN4_9BACT|nr:alpha-L-fucosidase [Aeoliella mucimassa]QDU57031.1 Alpha-L-fucosidase [Aeoliella mucimassa]
MNHRVCAIRKYVSLLVEALPVACLAIGYCLCLSVSHAAEVTNYVKVNFNGNVSGSQYTLAAGERDLTNSFRVSGTPSVTSGIATVNGSANDSSGFYFNADSFGSLPNVDWLAEVVYQPTVPASQQPGTFNHLVDVEGDLFLRYSAYNQSNKLFEYGFYDGAEHQQQLSAPSLDSFEHWALAWDSSADRLSVYRDGSLLGSQSGSNFATPSPNVGFGFFARTGFFDRSVEGLLDAVSFSTYSGDLVPWEDFQLLGDPSESSAIELVADTTTGQLRMVNVSEEVVQLNGYEVTSESGALMPSRWTTLESQAIGVDNNSSAGWQAGGYADENTLLEGVLLGNTSLQPGDSLWLGYALNTEGLADLELRYRIAGVSGLQAGKVTYDSTLTFVAGDYNNDGLVDLADYTVWRDQLGSAYSIPNDNTPDSVSFDDYQTWKANFSSQASASALDSVSVPEPHSTWLWTLSLIGLATVSTQRTWRGLLLFGVALLAFGSANAQDPPTPYGATPTARQLAWHEQEYYAFLHFGPNTFTDEEWGWSQSTPDVFNPTSLDTDQWARSLKQAGMTAMILTAKHHDGMALWDTTTTEYRIGNSTWATTRTNAGLETDVVRMAAESAKAYGLKFGVYLSPWDMHRDPSVSKANLVGTPYDEPQNFGDANGSDYNDYYAAQLTELVTMTLSDGSPIELSEVWLDGASGSTTVQTFDWSRYRDIIRQHQPNAVMWGHQGVDARWVGNEEGYSPTTNWHTIDRTQDGARYSGSQLETGIRNGDYWTPAEADARLRDGWFYHEDESPKSTAALMEMYLNTVGRSVNLLLDVPPGPDGKLADSDISRLLEFQETREALLDRNLIDNNTSVTASHVRGESAASFGGELAIDGDTSTYWAMDDGQTTGSLEIDLGSPRLVDGFVAKEFIALGQRIGGYTIEAQVNGTYQTVVAGTSLGYQRIHMLDQPLETSRIRLMITQADATPLLSEFEILGESLVGFTGDVNYDGVLNYDDWLIYIQWAGADLTEYTAAEAFARGDFNGDFHNDLADFDLFVTAYDQWHGTGAFEAMLSLAVPESSSIYPLIAGVLLGMAVSPGIRFGGSNHD